MKRITSLLLPISLFLLGSCKAPKAPDYLGFEDLQVNARSLQEVELTTRVNFFNPNKYPLQLRSAEGDVFLNGNFVSRSRLDTSMTIPASDTFSIPVVVKINGQDVLRTALPALSAGEIMLKLEGKVNVGRYGIFRSFPFSYEGKQRISR